MILEGETLTAVNTFSVRPYFIKRCHESSLITTKIETWNIKHEEHETSYWFIARYILSTVLSRFTVETLPFSWCHPSPSSQLQTDLPVLLLRSMLNSSGYHSPVQTWWHRLTVTKRCLNVWQMDLMLMPFKGKPVGSSSGGPSLCSCSKCVIRKYPANKTKTHRYPGQINFKTEVSHRKRI